MIRLGERLEASSEMSKLYEWSMWIEEIPFIPFPSNFEVKVAPPFAGAVVRYNIRDKKHKDAWLSVYLDCYDILGAFGSPYWEVYPCDGDVKRVEMSNVEELVEIMRDSIDNQIETLTSSRV